MQFRSQSPPPELENQMNVLKDYFKKTLLWLELKANGSHPVLSNSFILLEQKPYLIFTQSYYLKNFNGLASQHFWVILFF